MVPETPARSLSRNASAAWKAGLVLESPALASALYEVFEEISASCVFHLAAGTPRFEIATHVDRDRPDLLFVELASIENAGPEWIDAIRGASDRPIVIAVNTDPEPQAMIDALRSGAAEFLCLPLRPAIFETMERIGTILESRQNQANERGRMAGILSAKGGCGATTLACFLGFALRAALGESRVL
ncbi:MAG: hypothetical protein KGN84_18165, partial [Acidobacteriota bacterium]|nr:hypothetical protein [Acidobacteriota bacterium]